MYCGCCRCHCHYCLSFLFIHTHNHTHSGFFLLLLCCHFCCRDIVSNIVVTIVRQHQDCSLPLLRTHTKELHYLCVHVCAHVYDRFHNNFMFFTSSNPKYFINMVDYLSDSPIIYYILCIPINILKFWVQLNLCSIKIIFNEFP